MEGHLIPLPRKRFSTLGPLGGIERESYEPRAEIGEGVDPATVKGQNAMPWERQGVPAGAER